MLTSDLSEVMTEKCCVAMCRKQHGDYFGIGVAGYPEAHPDYIVDDPEQMKKNYWESLAFLKQKVGSAAAQELQQHRSCLCSIALYWVELWQLLPVARCLQHLAAKQGTIH